VQPRQLVAVLVAFVAILGVALFVVSWSGGDDESESTDATSTTSTTSTSTTSTTTSTTTTTIPTECTVDASDDTDGDESTPTDDPAQTDEEADDADGDSEPVVPTLGANSSVSTVGLDTVNFGMTVFQAEQAAGTSMIPCEPVSECYRVTPVDAPEGISFVVHEGTIERVDIASGPITTVSGVGIGTDESRIIELFGDQIERDPIDDATTNLVFVPTDESDAEFRVVFTMRDGVVQTFRSGRVPLVLDATPCTES